MRLAVSVALASAMVIGAADVARAEGPLGLWKTAVKEDGRFLHVRIATCDAVPAQLCGTVAGAFGGADEGNIGKPIVWDMEPDGADKWSGGRVWAADEDEVYRAKMRMAGADTLTLSGCILGGLICRDQDWTRVAE